MKRLYGKLESASFVVFGALLAGFALKVSFYFSGSASPDYATGRTYPVQMHGTLYVETGLGMLSDWLLIGSTIPFAIALAIWNKDWLFDHSKQRKDKDKP